MPSIRRPGIRCSAPLLAGAALVALCVLAGRAGLQAAPESGARPLAGASALAGIPLVDAAGKTHTLAEFREARALVLVFLGTRCPVSNSYARPLSQMAAALRARGARFIGINAVPDEDVRAVGRHAREYHLGFPVFKDRDQALADALEAQVTPEAFVLAPDGAIRYHGRIDDQYASRSQRRTAPGSRDLERAVEAVLAGRPVAAPVTTAIGCAIARPRTATSDRVVFHRDIEPIFQERCQGCHRPGQVAPFSLLTYGDARSRAADIRELVASRKMPPWQAEPGHGDFQDSRRLADAEIEKIRDWVEAGAPEGSRREAPAPRKWSQSWALGEPDLVLTVPKSYTVAATGEDEFHCFVLPTNLTEDRQVVAMDFRPGNNRVVHHVVSFVDTTRKGRELDAQDPAPGYTSGPGGIKVPGAQIEGVWAPGNFPRFLPKGVGRPLPKGADIILQMHYHKTGKPEVDQTKVALYFAKEPVTRAARTIPFGPFSIDIPPGEPRHEVKASMKLPSDMRFLTIMPHMHLLGKEMKVTATLPDGTTRDLVWVKDWDYRWQDSYRYREPVMLPSGTRLDLVCYYDNTTANPRNPSNPPRRVHFGEQTTDEMGFAIVEAVMGKDP